MVDIHTIGAGGGRIARITTGRPPAGRTRKRRRRSRPDRYGRGGTDRHRHRCQPRARRLNPDRLTGRRRRRVDRSRSRPRSSRRSARRSGSTPIEAAAAILAVTSNHLASAIRLVSVEKGHDPRDFALFAFGGAGPLHAVTWPASSAFRPCWCRAFPGITSALGCVLADLRHDFVQHPQPAADVGRSGRRSIACFAEYEIEGRRH